MDVILQQVRDQRVPPPRAAYNLAMPTVAGFLAANGVERRYHQAFGIGDAPTGCNAEIAYAAAFSTAVAEVLKTPFLADTSSFLRRFPDGESKTRSIEWGKRVGKHIVRLRVDDGSEPSEVTR